MMPRQLVLISLFALMTATAAGQNTNSSTTSPTRGAGTNTNRSASPPKPTDTQKPAVTPKAVGTSPSKPEVVTAPRAPGADTVLAAFERLLNGIRKADVKVVTGVYWRSPSLILFNNNGTVTKGWEQMRKNRENSYPDLKDVKLEVKDVSITVLGRDGALVSCLWTQSQTYKDTPETASGRMTLVFKRVAADWKAIHLHTSRAQNPSPVLPSEREPALTSGTVSTKSHQTGPSENRQEDPGIDVAYVTTAKANLRELPNSANILLQPERGDLLALIDRTPRGTWYNVIHVRSGKEGWVDGSVIDIKYTENPRQAPVFEERRVASNRDPELTIQNQTDRTLTLRLGTNLYSIAASSERSVTVPEGTYKFYGSVPRAYPTLGEKDFSKGVVYTWSFYIGR